MNNKKLNKDWIGTNLPKEDYKQIVEYCRENNIIVGRFISRSALAAIELLKKEQNLKKMI